MCRQCHIEKKTYDPYRHAALDWWYKGEPHPTHGQRKLIGVTDEGPAYEAPLGVEAWLDRIEAMLAERSCAAAPRFTP